MIFQEVKYCKYCNGQLKEIVYEIIEPEKTNYLERYYCDKCLRVFHFREISQKTTKKSLEKKEKNPVKVKVAKNKRTKRDK